MLCIEKAQRPYECGAHVEWESLPHCAMPATSRPHHLRTGNQQPVASVQKEHIPDAKCDEKSAQRLAIVIGMRIAHDR